MRRSLIVLVIALVALGAFAGGLAWLLDSPSPRPGAPRGARLCHGSWHAALFLIRPGDLSDRATTGRQTDDYLFDIIKEGGSPIGRPLCRRSAPR